MKKYNVISDNALKIAKDRYFFDDESTWEDCSKRVGSYVADVENGNKDYYSDQFAEIIYNMDFLPGGRILRNAKRHSGSMFNCYVVPFGDSIEEIGQFMKDSLTLWSEGGGVGTNLSYLRPRGAPIKGKGGTSSGPVSFLEAADGIASTIESGGSRRAAGLACMNVEHPDIQEFIDSKMVHGILSYFNLSVAVTEEFLEAVESNEDWIFKFNRQNYGKIPATEIWDKIVRNMVDSAEPGLLHWDNLTSNNSYYFQPIQSTNPCGEVPLSGYGCCNLGSLVLPHFITGSINTNWKKLERAVKLAIRFLDDVIECNKYVLKDVDITAHQARRVGLGVMGLAEYLFAKKLRYGSQKAIYEVEKLMRFIRDVAYETSIELAMEKGAFPQFDPVAFGKAHFVRTLPASIRMKIKEHGTRNVTLLSMAPTGCLVGDALIPSNKGVLNIKDYEDLNNTHTTKLCSDFSFTHFKKFFDQGYASTILIKTKHGYSIEGTFDHKVRVITDGNGYMWKKLEEITSNDYVVLKKGGVPFKDSSWVRNDLAELIGFYSADGWWTKNGDYSRRLYFKINYNEVDYVLDLLNKCFKDRFNINSIVREGEGKSKLIEVNSKKLFDWFEKYNLVKDGASNIFIPDIILKGTKNNILSFIKGFFLGDGSYNSSKENIKFTTTSEKFAKQLHIVLINLGYVSTFYTEDNIGKINSINGRDFKSNYIVNRIELTKYYSKILANDLNLSSDFYSFSDIVNYDHVLLTPAEYNTFNFILKEEDRDIFYVTDNKYKSMIDENSYNWFVKNNLFIDKIEEVVVNEKELKHVYDIEVSDSSHTYVANGFVTHNTISMLPEVSSGIEPLFKKAYKRCDAISDRIYVHPLYKETLENKNKNEDISEWFVDSDDLNPEDHLEVQSIVQKYVDSSVSKTINMPSDTTPDQLSKLLLEYIHDLKGVTVYVDGSRDNQVLNHVSEEEVMDYIKQGKEKDTADIESVNCPTGKCEI